MNEQMQEENGQWVVSLGAGTKRRCRTREEAEALAALFDSIHLPNRTVESLQHTINLCHEAGMYSWSHPMVSSVEDDLEKAKKNSAWRR